MTVFESKEHDHDGWRFPFSFTMFLFFLVWHSSGEYLSFTLGLVRD